MNPRPSNGRMRSNLSCRGAAAVGITICAFAVIIFVMAGGGQP